MVTRSINMIIFAMLALTWFLIAISVILLVCLALLPWRRLRIYWSILGGKILSYVLLRLIRTRPVISHKERISESFPAIYVYNHTSTMDIFLSTYLCQPGSVLIAKKEIVYIPFLGWLYFLSGHLRIDRRNHAGAIEALHQVAQEARKYELGILIFPEGTRSKNGRLQPFKKGFANLAIETGYPVVPIVVHHAPSKWSRQIKIDFQPMDIKVEVLEPIDTSDWSMQNLNQHVAQVHQLFTQKLSDDQKPEIVNN